ncbi:MAG: right-handed parallel beta-helix repeat-containing protein [Myxococcaceae bacterium]
MSRTHAVFVAAFVFVALGCGPINPPPADGGTDAGTDLCVRAFPERIDTNYTVAKGCWLVLKTPVIAAGVTIVMEPGAKLVFSADTMLRIADAQVLEAIGTEQDPIIFTGALPVRGHWKGLLFNLNSVASHLDYVTVEYGGNTTGDADAANIKLTGDSRGARVGINHSTIRESAGHGLWLTGSSELPTFTTNVITKNALTPVSLDVMAVGRLDTASTYTGNGKDEVLVRGTDLTASATWENLGVPFHLKSDLDVATATLTLKAGVKLVLAPEVAITISTDPGALVTEGTAANPVVFTGETQTRGAWEGIVFDGSNNGLNQLRYSRIEYAGNISSDAKAAALILKADSHGVQVKLDHVTVRESQGYGLRAGGTARLFTFESNTFTQNALGPALVDANAVHQLGADTLFTGNDVDRVFVDGRYVTGNVTWHDLGVPYQFTGINLQPQGVWTLEPGVTLEMRPQTRIDVGTDAVGFHAVGTTAKPITITGSEKTNGSWDGIEFDTTLNTANVLDHCIIEYGGGGQRFGWKAMINSASDSHGVQVSVTNSTVRHSAGWGIYFNTAQRGAVTGNTYADNAMGDYFHDP